MNTRSVMSIEESVSQLACAQCGQLTNTMHRESRQVICEMNGRQCLERHDAQRQVARDAEAQATHPKPLVPIALGREMDKLRQKRHILVTDPLLQLAIQRLEPGEEVPMERHETQQQFLRVEQGVLTVQIFTELAKDQFQETQEVVLYGSSATQPDSVMIPPGTWHRLSNEALVREMGHAVIFYTLYAPPAHTKEEQKEDDREARVGL